MIFGLKEMKEFAESSDDPRVKALWKRLGESMSKNAKWCDRVRELEEELAKAYKGAEQGWDKYYKMEEKYGKQ